MTTTHACWTPATGDSTADSKIVVTSPFPRLWELKQHYFPQFEAIRSATGAPWTGGDYTAHMISIPQVLTVHMQPGCDCGMLDIEDPRLPLDDSPACKLWAGGTLDELRHFTGIPWTLANSKAVLSKQDFLNPSLQSQTINTARTGEWHSGDTEMSPAQWLKMCEQWLLQMKATGKPIRSMIYPQWESGEFCPSWFLDTQLVLGRAFGSVCFWCNPRTQAEADLFSKAMAGMV